MIVLIVARRKNGKFAPFVTEQVEAIEKQGVECQYFGVDGKGFGGYLQQISKLREAICDYKPDIIHAHYGLCGLLANSQRKIPVVTTYHGSDINDPRVLWLSRIAIKHSSFNIFVSKKNVDIAKPAGDFALIPCGINLDDYPIMEKAEARRQMGLCQDKQYVLFAGAFGDSVKNPELAKASMKFVPEAELLELKGYTRPQVATLMQAVDAFLMTSYSEGSPQAIKEAMVCGCPIVSVDVGDVKERLEGICGCDVVEPDAESIAFKLRYAFKFAGKTEGRKAIINCGLTNDRIASRIISIYKSVLL